ncbi:N-6 DNA methylase [Paraburkholderia sacchari]|uniref:N-6 DNA methylase n=1 Tax=Paraburkholderia sacchari TaxID=159450 RepID=A0A8T6ZLQ7_9BURK|nr:N-6 DNA methylase [Paraburkholderia sacchari]
MKRRADEAQLGFDFTFNETVAAITRINEDAAADPIDEQTGAPNAGRRTETPRHRETRPEAGYDLFSAPGPVSSAGVEDPRPVGAELAAATQGAGDGGRSGVAGPVAGPADVGTRGIAGRVGDADTGRERVGNTGDGEHPDRAELEPTVPQSVAPAVIENEPATDYVISDADRLGEGGAKTKYRDNIAALRLLATLQDEGRAATRDEQAVLVRYVGWGGIPQAFDHRNTEWRAEFEELAGLLSKDDYEAARRSTQDAHYTAQPVVEAVHSAMVRFGFDGGRILEPSIGSGNFVGLMPEAIREHSKVTGVELDPVTAQIARHLYPSASVINKGFQEVTIPGGYFDAVIGNPPFGNQSVYDANHRDISQFSIHNYFIAKSLEKLRDGGVSAFVVSNYFLDARDSSARSHIADRAHFLGAIRLPNTAFKKNALTEVTTDIVFFKKAKDGEIPDRSWVDVVDVPDIAGGDDMPLNQYYVDRPEMMLGHMERAGTMYAGGTPALIAPDGQDLAADLTAAIIRLPAGVYVGRETERVIADAIQEPIEVPETVKIGAYFVTEKGKVAQRLDDLLDVPQAKLVTDKNDKALERIKGMTDIRNVLRDLMRAERRDDAREEDLAMLRGKLNVVYDAFVKRNGHVNSLVNRQAMSEDPDYPLLQSLERDYDKGISKDLAKKNNVDPREPSAEKAAIFSKRVMSPRREVTKVESAKDALVVSMNETGGVDLDLMVRLSGRDEDGLLRELQGLVFQNPASQRWETADRYLTGNVKEKLKVAETAALADARYAGNVEALRIVQPQDIEPVDISIQLGSTWVPDRVVNDFVTHLLGNVHRNVTYQAPLGKWIAKVGAGDQTTMRVTWGTEDAPANEIVESILTNKAIEVQDIVGYDEYRNPIRKTNEAKTAAANQKGDEIRQAFLDWVWEDKDRRETLARLYNDRFNTNVAPRYDGSHLTLPGASSAIELRPHQKDAIWRGIQDGTELYDHVVGAGKTFACIATAMESKRMGLTKKAMFVVPNHLLLQWKDDIYKLYPDANVLIAEKSDFQKENRERLFARIATGDWDAVVVGHSSFKKIGMPPQMLNDILNEQIDDLTDAILSMKAERGDRVTIKEMEKARDRMKAKLERAAETGAKDRVVTFDELGIDAMFVDEADEFKNLFITTSLSRISGLGNLQGSDKAFDLFVKARYMQKQNDGRGVYFATGTPVANTIAEIYTMQRYMQYDELKSRGIHHFDAWASTFGQVVTGWELDATGVNYRLNSRFSKFQNVPELTNLYRSFADVITREDLQRQAEERGTRFPVPKVKGGKPTNIVVERSPLQARYMGEQTPVLDSEGKPVRRADGSTITNWTEGSIIHRMENLPKDPSKDNPLKITNDARKAGLDFRLIDPDAPDFEGSKTNAAIEEMVRIYHHWDHKRGTQLVFCDLSTPKLDRGATANQPAPADRGSANDEQDSPGTEEAEVSMDELLAGRGAAKFSVYDDIRAKLIARGIPAEEIRFIHEAKTDLQRAKLFEQVRRGDVRFLLGSTAKMGAGTNVQTRLVAEHHLDAPWRPRDLEQREGRIVRQGNELYKEDPDGFEVEILRYATKQTYDSRMWQTIEYKAGAIEQFRRGDGISRVIEDVAGEAANAAEMKAAATGNPLIFMQVQMSSDLKKLEALHSNYKRNRHALESSADWLAKGDDRAAARVSAYESDIALRDANTTEEWQMKVGQNTFNASSKDHLMESVLSGMQRAIEGRATNRADKPAVVNIGKYRGFVVTATADNRHVQFAMKGSEMYVTSNLRYSVDDKFSVTGFVQRMDNVLEVIEDVVEQQKEQAARDRAELVKVKEQLGKPFAQQRELELLRKNNADVMVELRKMQDDPEYVSTWEPATIESVPAQDGDLFASVDPLASERAAREAAYSAEVRESIDKAAADYLGGRQEPHRSDEFFNRGHDRLFEWDGGKEVHAGLIERIKSDRELALAVATAPGKRYASADMLDAAESVVQIAAAAKQQASAAGLAPEMPNRDTGMYAGRIVAQTEHYLVQDAGHGKALLHHRGDVLQTNPVRVGDNIRLSYKAGHALARVNDPNTSLTR